MYLIINLIKFYSYYLTRSNFITIFIKIFMNNLKKQFINKILKFNNSFGTKILIEQDGTPVFKVIAPLIDNAST